MTVVVSLPPLLVVLASVVSQPLAAVAVVVEEQLPVAVVVFAAVPVVFVGSVAADEVAVLAVELLVHVVLARVVVDVVAPLEGLLLLLPPLSVVAPFLVVPLRPASK